MKDAYKEGYEAYNEGLNPYSICPYESEDYDVDILKARYNWVNGWYDKKRDVGVKEYSYSDFVKAFNKFLENLYVFSEIDNSYILSIQKQDLNDFIHFVEKKTNEKIYRIKNDLQKG